MKILWSENIFIQPMDILGHNNITYIYMCVCVCVCVWMAVLVGFIRFQAMIDYLWRRSLRTGYRQRKLNRCIQILVKIVCIYLHVNAHGKGMNPSILSKLSFGWEVGQSCFFNIVQENQSKSRKNLNSKPAVLQLKIDVVPRLDHGGGGVK